MRHHQPDDLLGVEKLECIARNCTRSSVRAQFQKLPHLDKRQAWISGRLGSAAMLVALSAIVPGIFMIIAMMIAIIVTFMWRNDAG
jgi:hypothetical protein